MLLLANLFWGLSFPVMKALLLVNGRLFPGASGGLLVLMITAPRFVLGGAILAAAILLRRRPGGGGGPFFTRREIRQGLLLGFFTTAGMYCQIDGLRYTSASVSAFLTQFYAILIPIWVAVGTRRWPGGRVWAACALVVVGTGILGNFRIEDLSFGRGEWETLLSSCFFMGQILLVNHPGYAGNRPMRVTLALFLVEAVVFLAALAWAGGGLGPIVAPWASGSWAGLMLLLAVFSTVGAFSLMVAYQPALSTTEAGLIYCTEPIFGALLALSLPAVFSRWAGIVYGNETVTWHLLAGGAFITLANVLMQLPV